MIRDLSHANFADCKFYLGRQVASLETITSNISLAVVTENKTEFVNEYMTGQYSELLSLLNQRKLSVIEHQITLAKKEKNISSDDTDGADSLKAVLEDAEFSMGLVHEMSQSLISNFSSVANVDASVDGLIAVLPEMRANQIKNGKLFISEDCKYLYYKGYAYEVYDPYQEYNNTTNPTIGCIDEWKTVHIKSYDSTTWDWWAATTNLNNLSSDDYAGAAVDNNSLMLNKLDAFFSVVKFIADARNDISINIDFQQNQYGNRRAIIGVNNSTYRQMYNDKAGTTISILRECKDPVTKKIFSDAAAEYYSKQSGNSIDTNKYDYDVVTTFDEGHKGQKYTSTISFDGDGRMTESVLVLPGDSVLICEQSSFLGINNRDVYNINLNATSIVPDQYSDLFKQGIKQGFE